MKKLLFLFSLFLLLWSNTKSQVGNFEEVGFWARPEPVYSIEVDSNKSYIGRGNYFEIINIENPTNPFLISSYELPARIKKISLIQIQTNQYAVVQCNSNGLYILNISDPNNIATVFIQLFSTIKDFVISNDDSLIYAIASDKLVLINIEDIQNPTVTTLLNIHGYYIQNYSKYIIIGNSSIDIYNTETLSVNSNPISSYQPICSGLGSCNVTSNFFTLYTGYIYLSCDISGETLGIPYSYSEIQVIDITQIETPTLVIQYGSSWKDAVISNNIAYVISGDKFKIIDLTNYSILAIYDDFETAQQIKVGNDIVYIAADFGGLQIVDVTSVTTPFLKGRYEIPQNFLPADDIVVVDENCYMIDLQYNSTNGGIRILDVSDRMNPKQKGSAEIKELGYTEARILYHNEHLYAFSKNNFYVFNVLADDNPYQVDSIHFSGNILDQKIFDNKLYLLTDIAPRFSIWSLDIPQNPSLIDSVEVISNARNLDIDYENSLAVISNNSQVQFLSLLDTPEIIFTETIASNIRDIILNYPVLSVVDANINGLMNYTINIIEHTIIQNGSFESSSEMYADIIKAKNNYYFLHDNVVGIYVIDNSDIDTPVNIATYSKYDTRAFCVDDSNYIFVTQPVNGMYILRNNLITGVSTQNNLMQIPVHLSLSQNYPNPFNPTTTIKYTIPYAELVNIKIYNILGEEVRSLLNDYKQAGTYEIKFDSENLVSGIYYYILTFGGYSTAKKMVLLR